MRWPLAAVFLLGVVPGVLAQEVLPARVVSTAPFVLATVEPMSFDLLDFRAAEQAARLPAAKSDPTHSVFVIKRHVGAAAGWDNGILHASVGMYVTVAELGRWNFGAPTVELGLGRYPFYDQKQRRPDVSSSWTVLVSLASVHYRVGYMKSIGYNCYINLEQVIDMHSNLSGSQFGLTFSRK